MTRINVKLLILFFVFFTMLCSLGVWQLSRAKQKEVLLETFAKRMQHPPLNAAQLNNNTTQRFYLAQVKGYFDNTHTLLLDNTLWQGQVGYEIYTPFKLLGRKESILIDRGFIPAKGSRENLPSIPPLKGLKNIIGMLNQPPAYFVLHKIKEKSSLSNIQRVEYIDLNEISADIAYSLLPLLMQIKPQSLESYPLEWKITIMSPEKHRGYALQWFALAFTLLIISLVLMLKR